jgi:hypothetical protein
MPLNCCGASVRLWRLSAWRAGRRPDGQITTCRVERLSSPVCKNILIFRNEKTVDIPYRPAPTRGAFRERHGRRSGMRWTLWRARRARPSGRPSRVVLTPQCRRQVRGSNPAGDGVNKAWSPGRARSNRKTLRGDAGCFRCDRGALCACSCRGRIGARHPRALSWEGRRKIPAKLGPIAPRE